MIDQQKTYGSELRRIRVEERWSLRHIAELIGVSSSYVSDIERGVKKPFCDHTTLQILNFMNRSEEFTHLKVLAAKNRGAVIIPVDQLPFCAVETLVLLQSQIIKKELKADGWDAMRKELNGEGY